MDKAKIVFYKGKTKTTNEFLFSNLHLGIFDNEMSENIIASRMITIKFNRIDMILDLNSKLIAN